MNAATPGQAAYEAFTAVRYAGSLTTDYSSPTVAHKAWEAAGAAVETEQLRLARADRDQLRKHVLALAADLDNSATATRPSRKSDIESELAIALRKIAEPPS